MDKPQIAKILVTDVIHSSGLNLLERSGEIEVDYKPDLDDEQLRAIVDCYDGLLVGPRTVISTAVLDKASNLKCVSKAGTGLDNIDVSAATNQGVAVLASVGVNAVSASEHAIALMMAASRHIPFADASMKAGKWEKKKFQGAELTGKTVGILGLGQIGTLVAKKVSFGLRMSAIGYDAVISRDSALQAGVRLVSIEELLAESDIITAHIPLTEGSKGLFDARAFGLMKKGAILINISDLGILDIPSLLNALESEKLSCAAIDVAFKYVDKIAPLLGHPRMIITPDLSAQTGEAEENFSISAAQNIVGFFEQGLLTSAINVPNIQPSQMNLVGPYLDLARRLGQFLGGLASESISKFVVQVRGEISGVDMDPISNAGLWGLLNVVEGSHVNYVNAPVAAKQRGIRVLQTTQKDEQQFGASIKMTLVSVSGQEISVEGALIHRVGNEPRIIGVGSFITEAVPSGPMLLVRNRDIPGMIAGVAGALAKSGANIAQMNLSRDKPGGTAISILNLDSPANDQTLEAIRSMEGIIEVIQVIVQE